MLLRQTLLYLPAQLVGPLALFVAAVVWTHLLPPEGYGTLMLVMAAQELVFAFGLSSLSLTVLRYRETLEKSEGTEKFRRAEAGFLYGSILVQTLAVWALMPFVGRATPALIAAAALFVVTRSLLSHLAERARSAGGVFWYTMAQTGGPLAGFALALALTRLASATPETALFGYGLVQLVLLPFVWARSGAAFRPSLPNRGLVEPLLRYGLPLLLSGMVTWFSVNGIRLVVDWLEGAAALGLLSVGWGLGQRIASTVAMLISAAAFPLAIKLFNQGDRAGAVDQLAQNGVWLMALLAPAGAGLMLIDEDAVRLLVAAPYWETTVAILPMAILSGAVRNFRMHYADQIFLLHERAGSLLSFTAIEATATLLGVFIGARQGGVYGAVAGALVAHLLVALFVFAQGMISLGLSVRWGEMARVLLATAVMALAVWLAPSGPTLLRVGFAVALGGLVYGAAIALLFPQLIARARGFARFRWPSSAVRPARGAGY